MGAITLYLKFYGQYIVSGVFWGFSLSFLLLCGARLLHKSGIPRSRGLGTMEKMAWRASEDILRSDQKEHSAEDYN